ncbi:MAG TPA: hypothetical protein VMW91_01565 [Desulfosporosinus sp.]|nr:hypothetical protein [Desulfosporosinus sp.]
MNPLLILFLVSVDPEELDIVGQSVRQSCLAETADDDGWFVFGFW